MRFLVVSGHAPLGEGTASGRILRAYCLGLRSLGHETTVWYWGSGPPPDGLPEWCEPRPLPPDSWLRMKARALVRPRWDLARAGWRLPEDTTVIADEPISFAAVARRRDAIVTMHYATGLDARALERHQFRDAQDRRAERNCVRRAGLTVSYSQRVADFFGTSAVVPVALEPVPQVPLVEQPTALLLANWDWPANRVALRHLLAAWPAVRQAVPHARLVIAGRGELQIGVADGVVIRGPVGRVADVFAEAAVLAFPCPATSGPKIKVLEAMGYGVPVVTTHAGVEGLRLPPASSWVSDLPSFSAALASALADPSERADRAARARKAVQTEHSPAAAARARVDLAATLHS